ncbi:RNA exonuclease 4-like isoform X4 [Amphibalanus amphitrite]|nr:RNA exonuclease 4-like isoform X4 [Amphibalanus amphitrite]XP_043189898.1 RNA exonuclease 4-like isoform X4 [Amphibalanus amphitrite]XP_043189899.1 RNA exonuclease 4-like isoform X4 [Amphibalanus amphitrite]XP_043189901.1 RNA exonuclease 4-like isoform X4 [Amphibalanus amphitrite]XP_043189902.1 RNA exonuclease 4-like isoform X4 [Amphibalanus amphitrite]XP_043189903.1 RNA exonuclease 4-like isoform X4 [Amphibalanus amphitrite]XP_043189904.1 RNA exonuclease 4-like isoform X4 [Amphibalanus am
MSKAKKRVEGEEPDISKALTPPKKPKPISKNPTGQAKQSSARRKLLANVQEKAVPKPVTNEDISSNWKSFLQAAKAAGPAPEPPAARRRPRGLAKRGCSCPPPVWFDGVDPSLLRDDRPPCDFCQKQRQREQKQRDKEQQREQGERDEASQLASAKTPLPSRYLAMDCEMVGVGQSGQENMLARVSIVNSLCQPVYDKFVKPKEKVTDYRTFVSGVRPKDLVKGEEFEVVQREVAALLKGRVLVGHAVYNDLKVLMLSHPKKHTRDTASYKPFRKMFNGGIPSLKNLSMKVLAVDIQKGEHDSVQDARATMQIYQTHRREWEAAVAERQRRRPPGATR